MNSISHPIVGLCFFVCFFLILLNSIHAANVPIKTIASSIENCTIPSDLKLNFSVNDPYRGTVSGTSGCLGIVQSFNKDGVVVWVSQRRNPDLSLSFTTHFSVYDPIQGAWKYGDSGIAFGFGNHSTRDTAGSVAGVVTWDARNTDFSSNPHYNYAAIYDPELGSWVYSPPSTSPSNSAILIDVTGVTVWRYTYFDLGNIPHSIVQFRVYDPSYKQFQVGSSPDYNYFANYGTNLGTVNIYNGSTLVSSRGYNHVGGWNGSVTNPYAYYVPTKYTGNVPLLVLFWDLSIGTNVWNWTFGDGGTNTGASPTYTYNSALNSPYTCTLVASGPGGSSSQNRMITPTTPHSISGTASNAAGFKIANATIALNGTIVRTTQTDANGNFSFLNLTGGGNYTVSISKLRYQFSPASQIFTNLNGSQQANSIGDLNDRPSDFDGDGKTDISIFRPNQQAQWWVLFSSNLSHTSVNWGIASDSIAPRDFDGDGIADIAVWRASEGAWYVLQSSTSTFTGAQFGMNGDVPVAGDYDGDDKADFAVFRPGDGHWWVKKSSDGQHYAFQWGLGSDVPVPGDYDGDNKNDLAVFRPSETAWYVFLSSTAGVLAGNFGGEFDQPVPGDYDGDGKTDWATFRRSDRTWRVKRSSDAVVTQQTWGENDDIPSPGDFDGDGKFDFAVFRPLNGLWMVLRSSDQSTYYSLFGINGDCPTPALQCD